MKRLPFLAAALILSSCAHLATVQNTTPRAPVAGDREQELQKSARVEQSDPLHALGGYLDTAHVGFDRLQRNPGDKQARDLYNYSVARAVEVIEDAHLNPWDRALEVPAANGSYSLTVVKSANPDRNPANYQLIPADTLVIGGSYFDHRVTVEGVGAPVVASRDEQENGYRESYLPPRIYFSATAIIRFRGQQAALDFGLPLQSERVSLGGHEYPLAADLTVPVAVGLARERPEKLGLARMIHPEKFAETARLMRLQVYDPNRIPVIFVHGLQDTPASWTPMLNALYADPDIRRRYQFWVFSYPSGYPYPYSAVLLRKELDGVNRAFPGHKKIVLIGHSMGGNISRLMITDVGDKLWRDYFGKPPAETNIPGQARRLLEETLIFNHRPEIERVIFICAPHRGAPMGANWIGQIATRLVRMPFLVATVPVRALQEAAVPDPSAATLNRIPTSIDTLSPENRFVKVINTFSITPGIPYHTIEGDRGRGDAPNSSDGVVPYWSSNLPGAESSLVVPSNHSAPRNPEAIAEVRRILHLNR